MAVKSPGGRASGERGSDDFGWRASVASDSMSNPFSDCARLRDLRNRNVELALRWLTEGRAGSFAREVYLS